METVLSILVGIGLAAACGFRVFVPLLVISIAGYTGHLELSSGFGWLSSLPALITFAIATALEVVAYYVPWLDHFLDSLATPAAVVAGTVAAASVVTDLDPYLKWILAVIAGGGVAGVIQATTVAARGVSFALTGGLTNPLVATVETGGSVITSALSLVAPLAALGLVGVVFFGGTRWLVRRQRTGLRPDTVQHGASV